jgi:heme-degrading monooxygenase HmoA
MDYHLAQVNIAIARYAYDDPRFAGFVDNLVRVYDLAESTPGFVWRHITVNDDLEAKEAFGEPNLIFNMSVWESKEALREFVYKSEHASILRQRADWFVPMNRPVFALWWQPVGEIPTIVESRHRLERLQQAGPTEDAFTFRNFFEVPLALEIING